MSQFKLKIVIFCLVFAWLFNAFPALACTVFMLKNKEKIYVGRNLDWPIGDGFIVINQKNVMKYSMVEGSNRSIRWKSKYRSVTFNQLGKEFPLGGMNESGLVVEELSYSPAVYVWNDSLPVINELQWIQYQLDNFSSVKEVLENLSKLCIEKLLFGLHYFIADKSGNSAVIEFLNGHVRIYSDERLPYPVLSNNTYENSIKYLRGYKGFGGEKEIISSRSGSQERFLYTTDLTKEENVPRVGSLQEYAFDILNKVQQQDTQWRIVYNPKDLEIEFRFKKSKRPIHLEFKNIDFNNCKIYPIPSNNDYFVDYPEFIPYSLQNNMQLLDSVFTQLIRLDEVDPSAAQKTQTTINQYLVTQDPDSL